VALSLSAATAYVRDHAPGYEGYNAFQYQQALAVIASHGSVATNLLTPAQQKKLAKKGLAAQPIGLSQFQQLNSNAAQIAAGGSAAVMPPPPPLVPTGNVQIAAELDPSQMAPAMADLPPTSLAFTGSNLLQSSDDTPGYDPDITGSNGPDDVPSKGFLQGKGLWLAAAALAAFFLLKR
jgi:hypothetical protein